MALLAHGGTAGRHNRNGGLAPPDRSPVGLAAFHDHGYCPLRDASIAHSDWHRSFSCSLNGSKPARDQRLALVGCLFNTAVPAASFRICGWSLLDYACTTGTKEADRASLVST